MSTAFWQPVMPFEAPPFPVRRFSVEEYHRMIAAGVLSEDEPVELLEGWIIPKMPRTPLHDATVAQSHDLLQLLLPPEWSFRVQSAITILGSEPEPDLAAVLAPPRRYTHHHPGAADIGLLIEVADSSLVQDRNAKQHLYARAGIEAYWILNLVDRRLEVYTLPSGESGYLDHQEYGVADHVDFILRGQVLGQIAVADLFPA
jgi:hypothetical protein